jgi:two-component system nitrogen regulation sensor histidine kinase NtrY
LKSIVKITWFVAGILFVALVVSYIVDFENSYNPSKSADISSFVEELEDESNDIFNSILPINFNSNKLDEAKKLKKQKWYLVVGNKNQTRFWNSNKISLDSSVFENQVFPSFYQFGDDVYCIFKKDDAYLAFRIANDGKLHQRVLNHNKELKDYRLSTEKSASIWPIAPMQFEYSGINGNLKIWLTFELTFILFFLLLLYLREKDRLGFLTAGLILLANIGLSLFSGLTFKEYYLLSASSFTQPNETQLLLLLFIHITTGLAILISLVTALRNYRNSIYFIGISVVLFFASDLLLDLGHNLCQNSPISFDFEKLFGLTIHSFSGLAFICLSLISIWLIIYISKISISDNLRNTWWQVVLGGVIFIAFQMIDASRSFTSLLVPILVVVVSILIYHFVHSSKYRIYAHFVYTGFLASILVFVGQENREEHYSKLFASQLVENKDVQAENILIDIENPLAQEFLVPEDYGNFVQRKDLIENRIKQLYFSNYLEKYELKLLSFDSLGININQNVLFSFDYLDNQYNNNTRRTSSNYFYQIKEPEHFNGYIAKYENCDINGHNGTTFILLQPRIVESEFLYPEVFANQQSREVVNLNDYSYGLYFKDRLINQKGSFSYQLNRSPEHSNVRLFTYKNTAHRVYKDGDYTVVLTKDENWFLSWLSAFTFCLTILIPLCFFISLSARYTIDTQHPLAIAFLPGTSKYLSSRIQSSLTIILLVGLLLSVYIIIGFIRANYNQNLENQLLVKVKNIGTQFQNKIDLKKKLGDHEQVLLMLNEESSTYKVDINLFNNKGKLLGTTKPYLIEDEVLGTQMNPSAFKDLTYNQNSLLLIQEELEGSDYLSAYVPLFDGKNEVIGYLNTPYFAKNEELNKQISSLVVNVLNIYFLLLLAAVFIAYIISKQISKPLLLIREKISKTELLGHNELIIYERDDEIGQLVKQYNKMVMELEESATFLAESEREGAWREMAKQVAHEIKNPLTPMQLSIQHLQRAYTNGPSEKLDALFEKTSKLLIEQINSLSNMASEFSNFAKMPEYQYAEFNLSESLKSTIDLFVRSENVEIKANVKDGVWVNADQDQMKRVFNNLVKNAIQAIPESKKGKVSVSLNTEGKMAVVKVTDNGSGIPEENYRKVFVPNFSTKNSGMGLGLAISRKIIETAGGNISFTTEINKGTTFEVKLPVIEKV